MRRNRRVKILATLGPSSSEQDIIEKLYRSGADVFRINMSHTDHDRLKMLVSRIRSVEETGTADRHSCRSAGTETACGHICRWAGDAGERRHLHFGCRHITGDVIRVHLPSSGNLEGSRTGHRLLLDDGKIQLKVTEASDRRKRSPKLSSAASCRTARASAFPILKSRPAP
jgi:pyruvate kinase